MNDWETLCRSLRTFRDERDWAQFHHAKDLAMALSIESGELLEAFLWKPSEEADPEKVKEELADVFAYALLLADKYGFDVQEMVLQKIKRNAEKYPISKAKGKATKYKDFR
jgi:NTP pyrophosphatase (non-canonical NTP hydrolase)